ncbi:F510_1955 family glycosylhydrolase [Arsenicicoccus bolidensis]|uniref:F510_1955 family glycosylhydrolase n=1 Tax=Arsenicicoccus bolidensis TaxID=229480 RepID=UPI0004922C06
MHRSASHGIRAIVALASTLTLVAGCSANADDNAAQAPTVSSAVASATLPSAHVHGVGRDPADGALLLATHEGLFRYGPDGPTRVGPIVDLMGFTIAGPGHYYASGHPNMVRELPQPMGLLESTDSGKTWTVLSRGGQSDFHTLTQAGDTLIAFDGQLRRTSDHRTWSTGALPGEPRTLSSDPEGKTVLATTQTGLMASKDQGVTWAPIAGAPPLLQVAWGDARTVAGVTPDGAVAMSVDGAQTWRLTGASVAPPQAMSASVTKTGLEILVVTEQDLLSSKDGTRFTTISK